VKRLIVFDLDGTLAESKSSLDDEMAQLIHALLAVVRVAVISGGDWPQFGKQLLAHLPDDECLANLSLLPTCGTKFFAYTGVWSKVYEEDLTPDDRTKITAALHQALGRLQGGEKVWGEVIEDRGSQITLSALGQEAPLEDKARWDPDLTKRTQIKLLLDTLIPDFSVRIGGATSIDVTKPGIDKAYGIRKLRDILDIPMSQMLFVGDALFIGGNDYPAEQAGVACIRVRCPDETKRVVQTLLACLSCDPPASRPGDRR
jgi:HAD superfamily hydrolase (TIGR01484 family)